MRTLVQYHVTNCQEIEDSTRFDLLVDGQAVLQHVGFMGAFAYLLQHMTDTDLYRYSEHPEDEREEDERDLTGLHLRATHAFRQAQLVTMDHRACLRCGGETTWIGYCDILPYGPHEETQQTFFMQCRECGYYVQVGFANGDNWQADTYEEVMQNRVPWVRTVPDPFVRGGTLRVTSRQGENDMGRLNLDGHEFHCGEPITIYDQDSEAWRDGRVEYGDNWYFIGRDDYADVDLRQGMRARRRKSGYDQVA